MKALSAIFNAPIIRRGTSNLDHIAMLARDADVKGFLVVYTNKGNPSVIDYYYRSNDTFSLFGRMFLIGTYINRGFRGHYKAIRITLNGSSNGALDTYNFLREYFHQSRSLIEDNNEDLPYCTFKIEDLSEITAKKLSRYDEKNIFNPAVIRVIDESGGVLLLKIKIHHVWKSPLE